MRVKEIPRTGPRGLPTHAGTPNASRNPRLTPKWDTPSYSRGQTDDGYAPNRRTPPGMSADDMMLIINENLDLLCLWRLTQTASVAFDLYLDPMLYVDTSSAEYKICRYSLPQYQDVLSVRAAWRKAEEDAYDLTVLEALSGPD